MKPLELISHFGTQVKTAAALGVTQGTVSAWNGKGEVPILRQMQAELITEGVLKADRETLRQYGLAA
jgi:hypothetical protein